MLTRCGGSDRTRIPIRSLILAGALCFSASCGEPPTVSPVSSRASLNCAHTGCPLQPQGFDHNVVSLHGTLFDINGDPDAETALWDLHPAKFRMEVWWKDIETSPGVYGGNIAWVKAATDELLAHGIQPYIILNAPPYWTQGCPDESAPCYNLRNPTDEAHRADWQAFSNYIVHALGGVVFFGYGNEMDIYFMPDAEENTRVARLEEMDSDLADAVHTIPGGTMVGLELSSAGTGNPTLMHFLNTIVTDIGYKLDAVAVQSYTTASNARAQALDFINNSAMNQVSSSLWYTEAGLDYVPDQGHQSTWITQFVGGLLTDPVPRLDAVFVEKFAWPGTNVTDPAWGMVVNNQDYTQIWIRTRPYDCFWDVSHGFAPKNASYC